MNPTPRSGDVWIEARADSRTTEEQLAELDREIEFYRRKAELERLKKDAEGEPTA